MSTGAIVDARRARMYARSAGILVLVSVAAGGFGEAYVPGAIVVSGNAGATAANILSAESLFRWGFAAYLVEAVCDTTLTLLLYLLLRGVRHDLALLAVFFRLLGTGVFAMGEVFYFAMLSLAGDDLLLAHTLSGHALQLATLFYGVGSIVFGHLMYRSGFLPRLVGALFALSGVGFLLKTVTWVLAPAYSSPLLLLPVGVAAVILGLWLTVKGLDPAKWANRQVAGELTRGAGSTE